jgi:uroporphyrin-III C-methyltransferase/precorrin-2 dehydrogenase/sirohydrochlorin ferrochelatase/uroporphyrin-III C-methyltransferase
MNKNNSEPTSGNSDSGCIYLVGAGPGDPELLTLKAARLLRDADVVVYDRLISAGILAQVPAGVTRFYVGKADGHHHVSQPEINALLLKLAQSGYQVVRLKGGDPFIFGRGSEEASYLQRHGARFEVVPGITAAAACAAYAGIPLTHRGVANGVQFISGRGRHNREPELDWQALAHSASTLALYMGVDSLDQVCSKLLRAGMPGDTPAAAIENGTTRQQRRLISTLAQLPIQAVAFRLQSPAMVVIGEVVNFSQTLDWFRPDSGQPAAASARSMHG